MSRKSNKITGNQGEQIAFEYLRTHGFKVIDRNWKIDFGEIDIIATKNKITYFIEVKTQFEFQQTSPLDELTPNKVKKLEMLSRLYSQIHPEMPVQQLLSAVCIWLDSDKNPAKIQWIENLMD